MSLFRQLVRQTNEPVILTLGGAWTMNLRLRLMDRIGFFSSFFLPTPHTKKEWNPTVGLLLRNQLWKIHLNLI